MKMSGQMNSKIRIRICSSGDEAALALIGQATFLEAFAGVLEGQNILTHCANAHSVECYRSWLADSRYQLWLAEISPGHAPIGYMTVAPSPFLLPDSSSRDLELKRIYIFSKFQGRGLGKRLLQEAIAESRARMAERLLLGVYEHNDAAIGFYTRMGFRKVGTRKFNMGGLECNDYVMGLTVFASESIHSENIL